MKYSIGLVNFLGFVPVASILLTLHDVHRQISRSRTLTVSTSVENNNSVHFKGSAKKATDIAQRRIPENPSHPGSSVVLYTGVDVFGERKLVAETAEKQTERHEVGKHVDGRTERERARTHGLA